MAIRGPHYSTLHLAYYSQKLIPAVYLKDSLGLTRWSTLVLERPEGAFFGHRKQSHTSCFTWKNPYVGSYQYRWTSRLHQCATRAVYRGEEVSLLGSDITSQYSEKYHFSDQTSHHKSLLTPSKGSHISLSRRGAF